MIEREERGEETDEKVSEEKIEKSIGRIDLSY